VRYSLVAIDVNGNCTLIDFSQFQSVWLMRADGAGAQPFSDNGQTGHPGFAAANDAVAFECVMRPRNVDICSRQTTNPTYPFGPPDQVLVAGPADETDPTYAPDG